MIDILIPPTPTNTTSSSSRILEDVILKVEKIDQKFQNENLENKIESLKQQERLMRLLQSSEVPQVSSALRIAKTFFSSNRNSPFLRKNLNSKYIQDKIQCYDYYFNVIQRGNICTLCQLDRPPFNYIDYSTQQIKFSFDSCDLFVPNCLNILIIQTSLTEILYNFYILTISQYMRGKTLEVLYNKVKALGVEEVFLNNNLVESCKKRARCDDLCKKIVKFGDFSNKFILGSYQLTTIVTELIKFTENQVKLAQDKQLEEDKVNKVKNLKKISDKEALNKLQVTALREPLEATLSSVFNFFDQNPGERLDIQLQESDFNDDSAIKQEKKIYDIGKSVNQKNDSNVIDTLIHANTTKNSEQQQKECEEYNSKLQSGNFFLTFLDSKYTKNMGCLNFYNFVYLNLGKIFFIFLF